MLDLHCHILFDVDDGAPDLDTAVEMARRLAEAGFTHVAASPHMGAGPGGDVTPELAAARRAALEARLRDEGVALKLLPNGEHHVTPELFERIRAKQVVSIGGESRWLLVELPWQTITDPEGALFRVQIAGFRLLLAHPERYSYLELDVCQRLVERGVKMQLELGSFNDGYGKRAEQRARALVDSGCAHVLATDLHRPKQADTWLSPALGAVRKAYGRAALQRGLTDNPMAIVADAGVDAIVPLWEKS